MKKIKVILPIFILLAAAFGAFAFKTKTAKATLDYGWYVMDQGTDPADPNSYSYRANFNPTTDGCNDGEDVICAIRALGDQVHPDISENPETDPNVDEFLKKDL
jgi:hypothetical protein